MAIIYMPFMAVLILHEIYSNLVSFEQLNNSSCSAAGGYTPRPLLYVTQYFYWKPPSKYPGYATGKCLFKGCTACQWFQLCEKTFAQKSLCHYSFALSKSIF